MKLFAFIPLLVLFHSCTPQEVELTEDIIQGEVKVVEQALQDTVNIQPNEPKVRPSVVPVKRFSAYPEAPKHSDRNLYLFGADIQQ